jgi:DNA repair exonuclease SbcCD ATPase subunit
MIVFNSIKYKNFLSTGNVSNEIRLDKSRSTLVVGKNGEGKSSVLDALCFVLFSKPFRNVNKGQLINSINGKNCLVEIEFVASSKKYKVIRGLKPNVFEIWCDGVLINQDAAAKDYQKVLEQQILKLNFKTFTQVVILGSASFTPFMQLSASQRREVIEDILDIKIFSTMNQLLKEYYQQTKDEIIRIDDAILMAKERVTAQRKVIQIIEDAKTENIWKLESKITEYLQEITATEVKATALTEQISLLLASVSQEKSLKHDIYVVEHHTNKLSHKNKTCEDHKEFFDTNSTCPSCAQSIQDDHKVKTIVELSNVIENNNKEITELNTALATMQDTLEGINKINLDIIDKNIELSTVNNTINITNKHISALNLEIQDHKVDNCNIETEKSNLKQLANDAVTMINDRTTLSEQKNLQEISGLLLKDTGIKTAIIREYLPSVNKFINNYLQKMDSYIHFELDEGFNEVIKSRFRDDFTYASFSEGEKAKIDLSLLFAWRAVAQMKNSVNTNLLILDETLDGALDDTSIELFLGVLSGINNSNIFVISHRGDVLVDKFDDKLQFVKVNDFSTIV